MALPTWDGTCNEEGPAAADTEAAAPGDEDEGAPTPPVAAGEARSLWRPPARAMCAVGVAGKLPGSCGAPGADTLGFGGSFLGAAAAAAAAAGPAADWEAPSASPASEELATLKLDVR
jgi:hypothetical protein